MAYAKVTDGSCVRFYDLSNPRSRYMYNELMNHNTGYNTVVLEDGSTKEFTEAQVRETIDAARKASGKKEVKTGVDKNKSVLDEE